MEAILLHFEIFFIVLIRVSGFFFTAPVIGSTSIPMNIKVAFSFFLTVIVFPHIEAHNFIKFANYYIYILIILKEFLIGFLIGIVGNIVFEAFRISGVVIGTQMGFAITDTIDPESQISLSVMAFLNNTFATLIFLAISGHLNIIRLILKSFDMIPIATYSFAANIYPIFTSLINYVYLIAMNLAIPALLALYVSNLALAFLARIAQKLNVFILGFTIKIFIGFVVFIAILPAFSQISVNVFKIYFEYSIKILNFLRV
jgi:flagellar biosynthetic protein FliR